jgi:hypothetical protein
MQKICFPSFADQQDQVGKQKEENDRYDDNVQSDELYRLRVGSIHISTREVFQRKTAIPASPIAQRSPWRNHERKNILNDVAECKADATVREQHDTAEPNVKRSETDPCFVEGTEFVLAELGAIKKPGGKTLPEGFVQTDSRGNRDVQTFNHPEHWNFQENIRRGCRFVRHPTMLIAEHERNPASEIHLEQRTIFSADPGGQDREALRAEQPETGGD